MRCKILPPPNNITNTKFWKEYIVGDLFDIHPTKAYQLTNAKLMDGGNNPIVVNSSYYNGIGGYTTLDATENGEMITFSDTVDANTIFYQDNPFVGYPHVQGLYPKGKYKDCWTKYSLLFFTTLMRKSALTKGFDYGNKFRRDIAITLKVILPTDKLGNPDWDYMESHMINISEKVKKQLDLQQAVLHS